MKFRVFESLTKLEGRRARHKAASLKIKNLIGTLALFSITGAVFVAPPSPAFAIYDSPIVMEFAVASDYLGFTGGDGSLSVSFQDGTNTGVVEWFDSTNTSIGFGTTTSDAENPSFRTSVLTNSAAGLFTAKLSGGITSLEWENENPNFSFQQNLVSVSTWGDQPLTSLRYSFSDMAQNFTIPNSLPNTVTDLTGTFSGSRNFNQAIGNWDTSSVTSMGSMFNDSRAFNQDIGSWNTVLVTTMDFMFYRANDFNADIGLWNTSKVTSMASMFERASSFNQPIGLWNTAKVTSMHLMFSRATAFNKPIGGWNTSAVTDFGEMFESASAFNNPLAGWSTIAATDMSLMFAYASAFDQPIGSWNTSKVTDLSYMFNNAVAFNQDLSSWVTSSVTDMAYMFNGALVFNSPLSPWGTGLVTDMSHMFSNASAFNQPVGSWDTSHVTSMSSMFKNASSFDQDISTKYTNALGDIGWDTSSVQYFNYAFSGAASFNQDIGNWDTSAVTSTGDMEAMFDGATNFSGDLSSWCVAQLWPGSAAPTNFDSSGPTSNASYVAPDWSLATCPPQLPPHPFGTSGGTTSTAPIAVYQGPTIATLSNTRVSSCEASTVEISGSRLDGVALTIQDKPLTILESGSSRILVQVPAGLDPEASADIKVSSGYGTLTVQGAVTIFSGQCSSAAASGAETKTWTKNQNDGTVKMYAKNVVGAGKIQFMVNGKEIAWVRASSAADSKLRTANDAYYLVRTVYLVAGQKNILEIYIDGVRTSRTAYSF